MYTNLECIMIETFCYKSQHLIISGRLQHPLTFKAHIMFQADGPFEPRCKKGMTMEEESRE